MVNLEPADFSRHIVLEAQSKVNCAVHLLDLLGEVSDWGLSHPGEDFPFRVSPDALRGGARQLMADVAVDLAGIEDQMHDLLTGAEEKPAA